MEIDIYESPEYKRSRAAYMAQCTFEYFISLLVTDAFLAKLLTHIGISDSVIGIISSLITFSFLFQLLAIYLMAHLKDTKKTVILFDSLSQLFFLGIYMVPFLPVSVSIKTSLAVLLILFAYIFKYLILSLCFKWANSYVNPHLRGEYSAVKEMISLVSGIIFTLIVGYVFDFFENMGDIHKSFIFIAISMLILSICNFISLVMIKNENKKEVSSQKKSFREVMSNTLGNKSFVNVIIMTVLWDVGRYLTIGFLGTFKTSDLLLSVGAIQLINIIANFCRMAISKPFGRYSDKTSYAKGFRLALCITLVGYVAIIFCNQQSWWLIVVYTIFVNVGTAGTNQNSYNITYNYVRSEYIVQAMAVKNSISGTFGFCASLIGSRVLAYVQSNGNTFLGLHVYGQQVLAFFSVIFIILTILFIKFVIEKQDRIIQ